MPTTSEIIAQALQGQQQRSLATSPLYQAGSALATSKPQYNLGDPYANMAATIGQQMLGGFLGGMGQARADQQTNQWYAGMPAALQSYQAGTLETTSPQYQLAGLLAARQAEDQLNMQKALQQASLMQQDKLLQETAAIPAQTAIKRQAEQAATLNALGLTPQQPGAVSTSTGTPGGSPVGTVSGNWMDEKFKERLLAGYSEAQAKDLGSSDLGQFNTLSSKWSSDPDVRLFSNMTQTMKSLAASAENPNGPSDLDFTYGVAKIIDPTAVVREGDAVMIQNTAAYPQQLIGALDKLKTGGKLTETSKKELLGLAGQRYNALRDQVDFKKSAISDVAKMFNLPADKITQLPQTLSAEDLTMSGDDPLTQAQIEVESSGNQNAVSKKGAIGKMQLMPDTAQEVARELGETWNPKDATQNVRFGKYYREKLKQEYGGNEDAALMAYNWGKGRVKEAMDKYALTDPMQALRYAPKETQDYLKKVRENEARIRGTGGAQSTPAAVPLELLRARPREELIAQARERGLIK